MPAPADIAAITAWLTAAGHRPRAVTALTGDLSLRRYFRAQLQSGSAIVALYPGGLRPVCRRFAITGELLAAAGVPTPRVLARDCRRGLMLLEDCGERTLYEEEPRPWEVWAPVYRQAAEHLRGIQRLPPERVDALNPRLDAALLRWELRKSWDLFLVPEQLVGDDATTAQLAAAFDALCAELGREHALRPAHRDFMPRNLMLHARGLLVLDHQDLRLAPPAYDLASLLNDSLFPPAWLERELVDALLPGTEGWLAYRRAVVQRSIKAIGNYCDFARRGHPRHLPLVRPSLARAWRCFAQVPELSTVHSLLRARWEGWLGADLLH